MWNIFCPQIFVRESVQSEDEGEPSAFVAALLNRPPSPLSPVTPPREGLRSSQGQSSSGLQDRMEADLVMEDAELQLAMDMEQGDGLPAGGGSLQLDDEDEG